MRLAEAVDAIPKQIMRFMRYCRTDQSIDEFAPGFDLRRYRVEDGDGRGIPRTCAPKSLVGAGSHKSLTFEEGSVNVRRLSGSRGGNGRQDAVGPRGARDVVHGGISWAPGEQ